MKKKIKPEDQSKELGKARFKFLRRNKEQFDAYLKKVHYPDPWLPPSVIFYPSVNDYLKRNPNIRLEDLDNLLCESMRTPAVLNFWEPAFDAFNRALDRAGIPFPSSIDLTTRNEHWRKCFESRELDKYFLEELEKDSPAIIRYLMADRAAQCRIVSIDLSRSVEAILAEVKEFVESEKKGLPASRLKWLSNVDELLEVWDLYEKAGKKPTVITFKIISKIVKRPLSTVRSQWKVAHIKIKGIPYDPESKYATEETRANADELCAKCPHGARCYKNRGAEELTEWIPCSDYMKTVGREKNIQLIEYQDNLDMTTSRQRKTIKRNK